MVSYFIEWGPSTPDPETQDSISPWNMILWSKSIDHEQITKKLEKLKGLNLIDDTEERGIN